jgi:hypothetical protein
MHVKGVIFRLHLPHSTLHQQAMWILFMFKYHNASFGSYIFIVFFYNTKVKISCQIYAKHMNEPKKSWYDHGVFVYVFVWQEVWTSNSTQDVHSGRRNGALYTRKRRFTALIFILFRRNLSVRITTAVSGRFLLRNDHRFTPFLYTFLDWRITTALSGRFSPVYSRFRPFTRRSIGPG